MNMETDSLNELIDLLEELGPGLIVDSNKSKVLNLLTLCWQALPGSDDQNTHAHKLHRAEDLLWNKPKLSFTLERHGATVNGSSRAELHHWVVNLEAKCAEISRTNVRQLSPMSTRMDCKKIAEEVADRILNGEEHETIEWRMVNYAVLNIGKVIPETNQQTTANRRRRFREALEERMQLRGWIRKDLGNKMGFVRPSP